VTARTVFASLDELRAAAPGTPLGESGWITITPDDVDRFAAATGAAPEADGAVPPYLVLALSNRLLPEIVEVRGISAGVNYGTGAVRFPAPLPIGGRLRARADLVTADEVAGGVQTTIRVTLVAEGAAEPACVIDSLSRWLA
jgi:acyl dehydratase